MQEITARSAIFLGNVDTKNTGFTCLQPKFFFYIMIFQPAINIRFDFFLDKTTKCLTEKFVFRTV